jgi:selenocysteine lyase/cysteine desulfurase
MPEQAQQLRAQTDELLASIRKRFVNVARDPVSGSRIYFENAGGTLRLKSIFPVIRAITELPDNGGRRNPASKKVDDTIATGRRAVAAFLGARSGQIVTGESATGLIFRLLRTIARGVPGANVVTTNLEHAAAYDATHMIAKDHGLEARVAALEPRTGIVPAEAVAEQIDSRTVVLTVIHSSNVLGTKNDVAAIVRAARKVKPDLFIVVDGAQHASHGLVDVEAIGADAYVFDPYKVFAKPGIAFAHVSHRLAALPHDNLAGKQTPGGWDMGTRDPAGFACITEVVAYFRWLGNSTGDDRDAVVRGMHVIDRLETDLMQLFLHGRGRTRGMLAIDGVTVYGQTDDLTKREAIFAFNVRGRTSAEVVAEFAKNGISLHNRLNDAYSGHTMRALGIDECVRVSACHYNTPAEVLKFLRVLARIAHAR